MQLLARLALAALAARRAAPQQACLNAAGDVNCQQTYLGSTHWGGTTVGALSHCQTQMTDHLTVADVCTKACGRCVGPERCPGAGCVPPREADSQPACFAGGGRTFADCCTVVAAMPTAGGCTTDECAECWGAEYTNGLFETCCFDLDPCRGVSCGHGACVASGSAATCHCDAGWVGSDGKEGREAGAVAPFCNVWGAGADPCAGIDCGAHGSCDSASGACVCLTGYTGAECESWEGYLSGTVQPTCWDSTRTYAGCCSPLDGVGDASCWTAAKTYASCHCEPPTDCIGTWGDCGDDCSSVYTVLEPAANGGLDCPAADGDIKGCSPRSNECQMCTPGSGDRTGYEAGDESTVGGLTGLVCATNYSGAPYPVAHCTADDTRFSFSGCELKCIPFSNVTENATTILAEMGYYSETPTAITVYGFGTLNCSEGFTETVLGRAPAAVCSAPNIPFVLSGCSRIQFPKESAAAKPAPSIAALALLGQLQFNGRATLHILCACLLVCSGVLGQAAVEGTTIPPLKVVAAPPPSLSLLGGIVHYPHQMACLCLHLLCGVVLWLILYDWHIGFEFLKPKKLTEVQRTSLVRRLLSECNMSKEGAREYLMWANWDLQKARDEYETGCPDDHHTQDAMPHLKEAYADLVREFQLARFVDEATARRLLQDGNWDGDKVIENFMPPVPDSPVSGRTLSTSNFRAAYETAVAPENRTELADAVEKLIRTHCRKHSIGWEEEGQQHFLALQKETTANADDPTSAMTQLMWTSFLELREREFSFIINEAIRDDDADLAKPLAALVRAINELCVSVPPRPPFPACNECYRGGGFDDRYRSFFVANRKFRQPAYLAASFSSDVAKQFMARSDAATKVRWIIQLDPELMCSHVSLVTRRVEGLPDEEEYLFAPYSVFTVVSASWAWDVAEGTDDSPHVIVLRAAPDNKAEPEDLPLAPWS